MVVKPQRGGAPRATMTVNFPAEVLTPDTKYSTPVAPVMARTPPNTIQSRLSASEHSAHSPWRPGCDHPSWQVEHSGPADPFSHVLVSAANGGSWPVHVAAPPGQAKTGRWPAIASKPTSWPSLVLGRLKPGRIAVDPSLHSMHGSSAHGMHVSVGCSEKGVRSAPKMKVGRRALRWEYSDHRLRLAQLLGQLGDFRTRVVKSSAAKRWPTA